MIYQTKEFYKKHDAEADREHGPDNTCETYYNRGDATASEICLTEGERENFEEEYDIKIMADVLHQGVFVLLLSWIQAQDLLHKEG